MLPPMSQDRFSNSACNKGKTLLLIPVITSDRGCFDHIVALLQQNGENCETLQLAETGEAEEFLRIEMPELAVIDFADSGIDSSRLLDTVRGDSWLLSTGLIGLCDSPVKLRESGIVKGVNTVALLDKGRISRQFPQVINIICNNRHMLFHRVIGNDFGAEISSSFELRNDPLEAGVFTNLICNYLFNMNCIDGGLREQLNFVLVELLINAIEHGNCGISYEEKTAWLEKNNDICELIDRKCENPEIAARKVFLQYAIEPAVSCFTIADEGAGFDWRALKTPSIDEQVLSLHGRGVALSREMTSNLTYNDRGNQVSFEFNHKSGVSNVSPALFQDLETVEFKPGETVFNEGEPSNYLYYIATGSFEVLVQGERVSTLRPEDIFLGEMSFLLSNRRSATVRAVTAAKLIRVSKKEFVEGIKEKPHYALFLSRLLARRIERLNQRIGTHKT